MMSLIKLCYLERVTSISLQILKLFTSYLLKLIDIFCLLIFLVVLLILCHFFSPF